MTAIDPKTQERLDWLVAHGVVTSLCYGPADAGNIWAVYTFHPASKELAMSNVASTFDGAVEIAVLTAINLEYVSEPVP